MINNVTLVGRLTKDPELRYTPAGVATCSFTLACNRPFKNAQGEQEADFINIVVWRQQAENTATYLGKGKLAGVTGRIQTRSYDNAEGKKVFVVEVVAESVQFLESKSSGQAQQTEQQSDPFAGQGQPLDISDKDLPF